MINLNLKDNKLFTGIKDALDSNLPTIATFGSLVGIGAMFYFMHKAAKEAYLEQESYRLDKSEAKELFINDPEMLKAETRKNKLDHCLQLVYIYRWALLSGAAAGTCALLSNWLNGRTIATMGVLLATNQDKLKKGGEKVKEMIGEEKFKELQDTVNSEIFGEKAINGELKTEIAKTPIRNDNEPPWDEDDWERYYDTYSGEIYELHHGVVEDMISEASKLTFLKWNEWRNMLGFDSCMLGCDHGWGNRNRFKAHIGWIDIGHGGMKSIIYDVKPVHLTESKKKR